MSRRVIVHNYLPPRKAKDAGSFEHMPALALQQEIANWKREASRGDPEAKLFADRQVKQLEAELNKRSMFQGAQKAFAEGRKSISAPRDAKYKADGPDGREMTFNAETEETARKIVQTRGWKNLRAV